MCVLFPGGGGLVEGGGGAVGLGPRSVFSKGFIFKPAWLKTVVLGSAWGFRDKLCLAQSVVGFRPEGSAPFA